MDNVGDILSEIGRLVRRAKQIVLEKRLEDMLGTTEVAKLLGVSVDTLRLMVARGELPAYKIGNIYKYKPSELDEYIKASRFEPRGEGASDKPHE